MSGATAHGGVAAGRNQPNGGLAPGCYWVRSPDPAYPGVFIAEWTGESWCYLGVECSGPFDECVVLSPRLEPPGTQAEPTWDVALGHRVGLCGSVIAEQEFTTESTENTEQSIRAGQVEVWSVGDDGWDFGRRTFIFTSHVAGVVALKEGGPTRLLFSGGGHYDICGSAEFWRLTIEIAQLKAAMSDRARQS